MDTPTKPRSPRKNVYFPEHILDRLGNPESLSGRVTQILDRYFEALRRTKIADQFTPEEMLAIRQACHNWLAEPAATIFGGIALELEDSGAPAEFVAKVMSLTPWEQVAMVEHVDTLKSNAPAA